MKDFRKKKKKSPYLKTLTGRRKKSVWYAEIFSLDVSRVLLAALIGSVLSPSLRVFFAVGIGVMFLVTAMLHGVDVVVC